MNKRMKIFQKTKKYFKNHKLLLFLILILAFFFRFYQVGEIPPPLYPDEAMYAQDGLKTALTNEFKVYYPANNGREGLFMWILAIIFKIFGPSLIAFKSTVAFFGFLTVLGIYLLGKEAFSKNVGLVASFFAAFSFWPVHFSRIGFRADLTPFFITFSLYFLIRGLNKKELKDFVLSGIFLGLGFYTYLAFRLIVLAGLGYLIIILITKRQFLKDNLKNLTIFLLTTFLVALPCGIYFLKNPQDFIGRASGISVTNTANPLFEFIKSFFLNFQSFFFKGDANWRHNFSNWPLLIFPISLFFAIGLVIFIKKSFAFVKKKENNSYYLLFSLLFFSMMLPAAMAAEGNPHALRLIGSIPAVFIITGYGCVYLFSKLEAVKNILFKTSIRNFLIFLLILLPFFEAYRYFVLYPGKKEVYGAFTHVLYNIAQYFNQISDKHFEKYVICNMGGVKEEGVPVSAQTVKFFTFNKSQIKYLNPEEIETFSTPNTQKNKMFALMIKDEKIVKILKEKFPGGNLQIIDIHPNTDSDFYLYIIK